MTGHNMINGDFPQTPGAQQTYAQMPLGLGNRLTQDAHARMYFDSLSQAEQQRLVSYIQVATTGEDAKQRVNQVVEGLRSNSLDFLSRLR